MEDDTSPRRMPTIDHQHARRLFEAALDQPPDRRDAYLQEHAAGNPHLLEHVRRLLTADRTATGLLERAAASAIAVPAAEAYVGRRIGRYTLRRLLGWGGMGRVYEATQEEPRRAVALKIIGSLPTPEARRRFRDECDVLALLNHPNIAALYEAFSHTDPLTGEELPCFAMELIHCAQPIHQFAAARNLSPTQRVELFLQACDAILHAHQRGVIHRDIKPGNLLVSKEGKLHVIDFGIARIEQAAAATRATHTGQLIGTLSYMSPEQCTADSRAVDLRSDLYSLGVVLYELLSGSLPYDIATASALEAARIIRDTPPTRLHSAAAKPGSDLEAIVLKALAKLPGDRYQSADEFAQDLRRWLADEPVLAKPPSPYRHLRHAWKKHRPIAITAAAVALSLVAGIIGTTVGIVRATHTRNQALQARLEADHRARAAQQSVAFLTEVLAAANPLEPGDFAPLIQPEPIITQAPSRRFAGTPGRGATANDLLLFAARGLKDALPTDPLARARVQASLGQILVNTGLVLEAGPVLKEAYETLRDTLGPSHLETARAAEWWAHQIAQFAVNDTAIELRTRALAARRSFAPFDDPQTIRAAAGLARAMALNTQTDQKARAVDLMRDTLQLAIDALGPRDPVTIEQRVNLAIVLITSGRFEEARVEAADALDDIDQSSPASAALASAAHLHLSAALRRVATARDAEPHAREALRLAQLHLGGPDAAGLEPFHVELHAALLGQRRWADAKAVFERQLAISQAINGPEHHATLKILGRLGYLALRTNDDPAANERSLARTAALTRGIDEAWRAQWYETYRAEALRRLGRVTEARDALNALRLERNLPPDQPLDHLAVQIEFIDARCLADLGRIDDARHAIQRLIPEAQRLGLDASRTLVFDEADLRAALDALQRP